MPSYSEGYFLLFGIRDPKIDKVCDVSSDVARDVSLEKLSKLYFLGPVGPPFFRGHLGEQSFRRFFIGHDLPDVALAHSNPSSANE